MKKVLSVLLVTISILNIAFYTVAGNESDMTTAGVSTTDSQVYANGLILEKCVEITKDSTGRNIEIVAETHCITSVVKCGVSKMVVERRKNSSYSWETFTTYEDFYVDDFTFTLFKSFYAPTGFEYRVITTHYAKKSIFSIQTGNLTSLTIKM